MRVTAASHPLLFEAFEDVSHDSGGQAGHAAYEVPTQFEGWVDDAERGLGTLTPDERNEFAIGEQDDVARLRARSPELDKAHQLLEALFEGDAGDDQTFGEDWARDC